MPEIPYKKLSEFLKESKNNFAPVYLIYGDEFLYKNAFKELLDAMLPNPRRSLNYEAVDGINENIPYALEQLNTFSLMPGTRVIAFLDAELFYSSDKQENFLEKAKAAAEKNEMKRASRYFLSLLAVEKLKISDISGANRDDTLSRLTGNKKEAWAEKIADYCLSESLSVPMLGSHSDILAKTTEKGFAKNNHLVITTEIIDKRRNLYKIIDKVGVIIECAVPKGERKADRDAQNQALAERMQEILSKAGKTMANDAFAAILDKQDFGLRAFSASLEKLINYVGDRQQITRDDVEKLLERTRTDPIYEFTNAFSERNVVLALSLLGNLLGNDIVPLQILAALSNQVRRLLLVKDFVEGPDGKIWHSGMNYNAFQNKVMPAVKKYDDNLLNQWDAWHQGMEPEKGKKKSPALSLVIAKNPKSAYPVFQNFLKSDNFSKAELVHALKILFEADKALKSTGQNPRMILEYTIISICKRR